MPSAGPGDGVAFPPSESIGRPFQAEAHVMRQRGFASVTSAKRTPGVAGRAAHADRTEPETEWSKANHEAPPHQKNVPSGELWSAFRTFTREPT